MNLIFSMVPTAGNVFQSLLHLRWTSGSLRICWGNSYFRVCRAFTFLRSGNDWQGLPWAVLNLTTLRLDGVALNLVTFPLHEITSLHLEDYRIHKSINVIDGANIFRAMPRLQSLVLMGSVLDMKDLEDASNISLPFLSFLQISDTDIAFTFMDIVSAPLLQSLVLTDVLNTLFFKRAVRSRFPSVNSLTITDTFLDLDSYAVMFHFPFPGLTHLAVLDLDVEPIFTLLCTASNPLLRCLVYRHCPCPSYVCS